MNTNLTVECLKELKLTGMIDAVSQQIEQPNAYNELSFFERLSLIIENEKLYRDNKKINRLRKEAKFKIQATIEDINYSHPRGLLKKDMVDFLNLSWMNNKQNILITGPTGCGKTFIACALGNHVCVQGKSVAYFRSSRLFESLTIAHGDGTYQKLIKKLAKIELLIIDDWGLDSLSIRNRNDLLEIIEDRHNCKSTIITSQIPIAKWHEIINDQTIADAILDRILVSAK